MGRLAARNMSNLVCWKLSVQLIEDLLPSALEAARRRAKEQGR